LNIIRKILFPFGPIYYVVTWIRNRLYDIGIKKSIAFDFPVIAVGNLSVGGTGKSPMIEYLIRLLIEETSLATLSRGYKRETSGFQVVEVDSLVKDVGDEPLQFKKKFPGISVGVDANRIHGIKKLRGINCPSVILLDDAYQHRKVRAGLYVLLTAYGDLYCDDIVLPSGNLREPRRGANRADIIVVTKCPKTLGVNEQLEIKKKLQVKSNQKIFFASIEYASQLDNGARHISYQDLKKGKFTLVTGIANPKPLVEYYKSLGMKFDHLSFPDHHNFSYLELKELKTKRLIVTTEKDYVRLQSHLSENQLWFQPIQIRIITDQNLFDRSIHEFALKNRSK